MARPCIAFLTDFGTTDHYAGTMKGVALSICPDATLIDITHEIAPQDLLAGALELAAAYTYFPEGTVFVAVVDPGVGSTRRAIAADAGGYRFVAPDNGLLSLVFRHTPPVRVVSLTNSRYARAAVSATFEGRDRFAPAASWLASGADVASLGEPITDWQTLRVPEPEIREGDIVGEVLRVDRFGNLITNIERSAVEQLADGAAVQVMAGTAVIDGTGRTYAETAAGVLLAIFSSTGHLELAVNGGSAAQSLGVGRNARVTVRRIGTR